MRRPADGNGVREASPPEPAGHVPGMAGCCFSGGPPERSGYGKESLRPPPPGRRRGPRNFSAAVSAAGCSGGEQRDAREKNPIWTATVLKNRPDGHRAVFSWAEALAVLSRPSCRHLCRGERTRRCRRCRRRSPCGSSRQSASDCRGTSDGESGGRAP